MSKPSDLPMIRSPRRVLVAGLFGIWGVVVLVLLLTGGMSRYLAPRSLPFVWVAAPVLLAVAVVLWRNSHVPHHGDPDDDMHEVSCVCRWEEAPRRTEIVTTSLMVLPLVVLSIIPTGTLGADAARTRGVTSAPLRAPGTADGGLEGRDLTVLDVLYASTSSLYADQIGLEQGAEVTLVGMAVQDADEGFLLTRFLVTCCVADAVPIAVRVRGPGADEVPDNQWVVAAGAVSWTEAGPGMDATTVTAELALSTLEPTDEPWDVYLY